MIAKATVYKQCRVIEICTHHHTIDTLAVFPSKQVKPLLIGESQHTARYRHWLLKVLQIKKSILSH